MRALSAFFVLLCFGIRYCSGQPPLQVDQAEVLRLGNIVQAVGAGPRAADVDNYVEAMGPPASDADKWFISVITKQGCAACEQLKRDWRQDQWLRALADPDDPKHSWAHYNIYAREDRSQAFRFEGIQVTAYPTVLVQPPRSGKYGDAKTIVFQGVYGSNAHALAESIAQSVRVYIGKLKPTLGPMQQATAPHPGSDAPWQPNPRTVPTVDSLPTNGSPTANPLQLIPPPASTTQFPWSSVLSLLTAGASVPTGVAVVTWFAYYVRGRRQAAGTQPLVDAEKLDRILAALQAIANASPNSSSSKRDS